MEHITVNEIVTATGGQLLGGDGDVEVSRLSIDSRDIEGGDLFVPLIGEKVDAHRFIPQVFEKGAAATFTSRGGETDGGHPWILVDDTVKALQAVGSLCRDRLTIPLVGVTGSVGKTTTREMISAALSAGFRVFKTPKNNNGQLGVPVTLSKITGDDEIAVIEMGMSMPGEMEVIARIARVDTAVITNVGVTHIENLGTRENILREKLNIQEGMKEGGTLLLNGDNDLLKTVTARPGIRTLFFGTGGGNDYRAEDVRMEDGFASFTAVHNETRVPVSLNVMGEHNVSNALAALAVAEHYGIPMEKAAEALKTYGGYEGRQRIFDWNGIHMDDDTYNASPDSMKAAVKVLCSMACEGRRIAVLADMKELGPDEERFHREVGTFIGGMPVDEVITLGELGAAIARGAAEKNPACVTASFMDKAEMEGYLRSRMKRGDTVLFKGSNSMKLGEVAAHFRED